MRTVKELITLLSQFPQDAKCYAYEGEAIGVGIVTEDGRYGFIPCHEGDESSEPIEPLRP